MRLVEATEVDLDQLVNQWHDLATEMEAYDRLNELDSQDIEEISQDGFQNHLDDNTITDYLVNHEDETIGFVRLQDGCHQSRKHSAFLRTVTLSVDENHRNHGYGTDVIERVK